LRPYWLPIPSPARTLSHAAVSGPAIERRDRAIPLRLLGGAESHLSVSCGGRIASTAIFGSSFVFDCGDLLLKERELRIKVGLSHLACPCSLAFSFPVCQGFVDRMAPVFSFAVL